MQQLGVEESPTHGPTKKPVHWRMYKAKLHLNDLHIIAIKLTGTRLEVWTPQYNHKYNEKVESVGPIRLRLCITLLNFSFLVSKTCKCCNQTMP